MVLLVIVWFAKIQNNIQYANRTCPVQNRSRISDGGFICVMILQVLSAFAGGDEVHAGENQYDCGGFYQVEGLHSAAYRHNAGDDGLDIVVHAGHGRAQLMKVAPITMNRMPAMVWGVNSFHLVAISSSAENGRMQMKA